MRRFSSACAFRENDRISIFHPIAYGEYKECRNGRGTEISMRGMLANLRVFLQFDNWPTLLLNRVFDRETGLVVYRKGGLEILIDHRGGDQNGTRACLTTDMYKRYLPKIDRGGPRRVLDLGSNGGGFPLMLRLAKVDLAQVVCVEMNRPTWLRLLVNPATNMGDKATGLNAAVSGMPADSEILLEPSRGGTGLSVDRNRADLLLRPDVAVRTTYQRWRRSTNNISRAMTSISARSTSRVRSMRFWVRVRIACSKRSET